MWQGREVKAGRQQVMHCHAKIHRTKAVLSLMPPLLLELWREQHPKGHEQAQLNFTSKKPASKAVKLFLEENEADLTHDANGNEPFVYQLRPRGCR